MPINDYVNDYDIPGGIWPWDVRASLARDLKQAKGTNFPAPEVLPVGAVEMNAASAAVFRNKGGRPRIHRVHRSRPWQAAGFATIAGWEAAGRPGPPGK